MRGSGLLYLALQGFQIRNNNSETVLKEKVWESIFFFLINLNAVRNINKERHF